MFLACRNLVCRNGRENQGEILCVNPTFSGNKFAAANRLLKSTLEENTSHHRTAQRRLPSSSGQQSQREAVQLNADADSSSLKGTSTRWLSGHEPPRCSAKQFSAKKRLGPPSLAGSRDWSQEKPNPQFEFAGKSAAGLFAQARGPHLLALAHGCHVDS